MAATSLQAQSLADVLGSVERNNTELKAMLKGNEAARLDLKQANNLEGLSVEYSPFFNSAARGIASSELVVTQGFDFPTLYGARRKAARLQGEAIDMQYRTARRDILLGAKQLCLDLIHMNKRRALLDERRRAADELLAMYTEKYDGGEATAIELNKVKMERMNLETELAAAENDRAAALQQLRAMNGGEPIECTDTLYPALPADGDEAMYAQAVNADLPAMAAAASVKAAEQDVKVSRQGWMPKLEIGYRRNTDGTDASNGFLIGGSIPLFANRHKVKQAKAERWAAESLLQSQSDATLASLRQLWTRAGELQKSINEYASILRLQDNIALLNKSLRAGQISMIEYFVNVGTFYDSMANYLQLQNDYQKTVAQLYRFRL